MGHLLQGATREELEAASAKDVAACAAEMGLPQGKKAEMVDAILQAQQAAVLPDSTAANGEAVEEPITPDEARRFNEAHSDMLRDWLDTHSDARLCLIEYVNNLLLERAEIERRFAEAAALRSDLEYYKVTKGGRYAVNGLLVTLPTGSAVTADSHDLVELRAAGIELQRVKSVVVRPDHMGLPRTRIKVK